VRDGTLNELAFPEFRERGPWWGGDLQTIRNFFLEKPDDLSVWPGERLVLDIADGTGDRLVASLSRPHGGSKKPLLVLIHGLTGCEESLYIVRSAAHLLSAGYPVLRLNLRGAGPSRPLCRFQYHAGRSEDLRAALAALPPALSDGGIFVAGYSLGANVLLKLLGEGEPACIRAAASVSAPIELAACAASIQRWRNLGYHLHILRRMKRESLAANAALTASERRAIAKARSVVEFDDSFTAPHNGYADAAEYYERNSGRRFLDAIRVPTLVITALDDPWIPGETYARIDWSRNPALHPLLARRGGHIGFNGPDRSMQWHDLCVLRFFAAH
jgi:predicted alpha/beta-fold hydrolase